MPNELFPSMAGMVFLKSNGATFSSMLYPKLAQVYPGLVLTDLREEFIRGWDDRRGVDCGRKILSRQGHAFMDHAHNLQIWTGGPTTSSNVSQTGFFAPLATGGDGGIIPAAAFRFQTQPKNDITSARTSIAAVRFNLMKRFLRSL